MASYRLKDFRTDDTVKVTDSIIHEGEKRQVSVSWQVVGEGVLPSGGSGISVKRLDGHLVGRVAVLPEDTEVEPIGKTAQRLEKEAERAERMEKMQQIVKAEAGGMHSRPRGGSKISKTRPASKSDGALSPTKLYVSDASETTGLSTSVIRSAIKRGELVAEDVNEDGARPTYLIDQVKLDEWYQKRMETKRIREKQQKKPEAEGKFAARGNRYCTRAPRGSKHPDTSWFNPFNVGSRRAGFYHTFKLRKGQATFDQLVKGCMDYRGLFGIEDREDLVAKDLNNHKGGWKRGVLGLVVSEKQNRSGEIVYVMEGFASDAPAKARA
jgi:hypothetical protein